MTPPCSTQRRRKACCSWPSMPTATGRIADVSEVKPPKGTEGSLQLVQPVYVDERMQAVVDVFDALQTLMLPEAAALAVADDDPPAQVRDPVETFSEKLTALREITKAGESR